MARTNPSVSIRPLPRVSVIGSGTDGHPGRAVPLGAGLARLGVHLVTGGGAGVMGEVARGFVGVTPRRGASIGILPAREGAMPSPEPPTGYPNPWVEIPVHTHLAARGERGLEAGSRNHVVVLTGDVVVAMPGGSGTCSEVQLAVAYGRPVVAYLERREELPGLPDGLSIEPSLEKVLAFVRDHCPRNRVT